MDNIDTAQISEFSNLTRILSNAEVSKNELIEEIQVLIEKVKDQTDRYDFFLYNTRNMLDMFYLFN